MGFNMDANPENADWTKQYWDLPPYKSAEFLALWPEHKLNEFRKLAIYKRAVQQGKIVDDEWAGDENDLD